MSNLEMGKAALEAGDHPAALQYFEAAFASNERPADAKFLGGVAYDLLGIHEAALDAFNGAIEIDDAHALAHHGKGTELLLRGSFDAGWPEYQWFYETKDFEKVRPPLPRWNGTGGGQLILLVSDQGLGDAIQFLRYGPQVSDAFQQVVFEGDAQLLEIAKANLPNGIVVASNELRLRFPNGARDSRFNCYAPLSSLPRIFGPVDNQQPPAPAGVPVSEQMRRAAGRDHCSDGAFKVGIAWRGSPKTPRRSVRDIPPEEFSQLANIPGVHFYCLDRTATEEDLEALGCQPVTSLVDPMQQLDWDLVNTASIIANMDLVITCDSVIAHLARSMMTPVWIALPYASEWRWGLQRDDSEWYPTAVLYRQPAYRQWAPVFSRMAQNLVQLATATR